MSSRYPPEIPTKTSIWVWAWIAASIVGILFSLGMMFFLAKAMT